MSRPVTPFAWDLLPGRRLGGSISFFSRHLDESFSDYENVPLVAAPTAGADSGRVMIWLRCMSCAIFPKPDGVDNVVGGRFGESMAVGIFAERDEKLLVGSPGAGDGEVAVISQASFRRWDLDQELNLEGMTNGTRECACNFVQPLGNLGARGAMHRVASRRNFRRGRGAETQLYRAYCKFRQHCPRRKGQARRREALHHGNLDCDAWDEVLAGSFPDEEFGAALVTADFDCDGVDDLAVGAPGAVLPTDGPDSIPEAGAVYVYRSSEEGIGASLPTILRQGAFEVGGTPEQGDRFGQTLVAGNFNGARRVSNDRSCYDLVVAAPGEDEQAGQIQLFEGGPNGLSFGGPIVTLDDLFDASADSGDMFGYALTAGDLNRDGFDELIIGAPNDALGGAVWVIPGSETGLLFDDLTTIRQGAFDGSDELGDQFGFALTWTIVNHETTGDPLRVLAVGVPGENAGGGQLRLYRAHPSLPGSDVIPITDFMMLDQADISGDVMSGDRFASVLMPPRAFANVPWTMVSP